MAGHFKWVDIKHKEAATDAKRGKTWTRLIEGITAAARLGGGDADSNPRLHSAMDKATDANMPKDNTNRAIQRDVGGLEGANYEETRHEGYGIDGVVVIVDYLTDNRTHTVVEVHHGFDKYGDNMGTPGSIALLFNHIGQSIFASGIPEDKLMDVAFEAGADDVIMHDNGSLEVIYPSHNFAKVKTALEATGLKVEPAKVITKPQTEVVFTGKDVVKIQKLLDVPEDLDDMQEVSINAVVGE